MIRKVLSIHQVLSILFFLLSLIFYFILFSSTNDGLLNNVQIVSIIGIFFYVFIFLSWKSAYFRILSPYFVFVTTLYLCLCGQSIMWSFGLTAGYRDLLTWGNMFDSSDICKGLLFSYCCILFLHSVVILHVNNKKISIGMKNTPNNVLYNNEGIFYKVMLLFGLSMCVIFIVPYLVSVFKIYSVISNYGYSAQYYQESYGVSSLISKLGEFFPVGVLTLFYTLGRKNEYNRKNYKLKASFAYLLVILYLICELIIGQRTGVILFSLAFLFIVFKNKKISKIQVLLGVVIIFVLMSSMRFMDLIRSNETFKLDDFFSFFVDYKNNPAIDFLGDIGWNLFTLVEYQKLMPTVRDYGYGISYIVTLTSIIPNINFWVIHPATVYGEISEWLRIHLGFHFGLGCTPIAEAYYNFGSIGFLIFYFWGKLLVFFNRKFEENSILSNYAVVLFIGILLKSCVRSSFIAVFRPMILYVFLPILIIKILYKKNKK